MFNAPPSEYEGKGCGNTSPEPLQRLSTNKLLRTICNKHHRLLFMNAIFFLNVIQFFVIVSIRAFAHFGILRFDRKCNVTPAPSSGEIWEQQKQTTRQVQRK